mmetsp:Transcript_1903/g.5643  ORF Transcript_1903/g.5643 Transcript_1903/m.5643 type:complete len:215 (-) Transcript_1903:512-1156(-)
MAPTLSTHTTTTARSLRMAGASTSRASSLRRRTPGLSCSTIRRHTPCSSVASRHVSSPPKRPDRRVCSRRCRPRRGSSRLGRRHRRPSRRHRRGAATLCWAASRAGPTWSPPATVLAVAPSSPHRSLCARRAAARTPPTVPRMLHPQQCPCRPSRTLRARLGTTVWRWVDPTACTPSLWRPRGSSPRFARSPSSARTSPSVPKRCSSCQRDTGR